VVDTGDNIDKWMNMAADKRFVSLRTKILILCLSLITIPFGMIAMMTYGEYMSRLSEKSRLFSRDLTDQFIVNLERYLDGINDLTLEPLYDEEVVDILSAHADRFREFPELSDYSSRDFEKLSRFVSSVRFSRDEIRSFRMYAPDHRVFSYSDYYQAEQWQDEELSWMNQVTAKNGRYMILPPRRMYYNKTDDKALISLARALREPFSFKIIGYVKVDMTVDQFTRVLFPNPSQTGHKLIIYNENSELIYPEVLDDKVFYPKGNLIIAYGQEYFATSSEFEKGGLTLFSLIPYGILKHEAQILTRLTIFVSVLTLIAAYIMAVLLSSHMIKPLNSLMQKMEDLRKGDFDSRAVVRVNDEIGRLSDGFNQMSSEIKRLIDEVYSITVKEQEAEIMLLQSQLNPHFLYNTLEVINMMAISNHQLSISDSISALGRMMRYTIQGQERLVPLLSEVEFLDNYLILQSRRLGERLKVSLDISEETLSVLVPRLILQPFVENTIEYGLNDDQTIIEISSTLEKQEIAGEVREILRIIISDNGPGISDEKRGQLLSHLDADILTSVGSVQKGAIRRGVGLQNINQRIKLLYGSESGILIPEAKEGTVFLLTFHLPVEKG